MKQVFHLDQILHLLWAVASDHTCEGSLSGAIDNGQPETLHTGRLTDAQMSSIETSQPYFAPRALGAILDHYHMRPRRRYMTPRDSAVSFYVAPTAVHGSHSVGAELSMCDMLVADGPRRPFVQRRTRVTIDDITCLLTIAEAAVWVFNCGEGLDNYMLDTQLICEAWRNEQQSNFGDSVRVDSPGVNQ